jgi:hypothetical protein
VRLDAAHVASFVEIDDGRVDEQRRAESTPGFFCLIGNSPSI